MSKEWVLDGHKKIDQPNYTEFIKFQPMIHKLNLA